MTPDSRLAGNIVLFCRTLRAAGIPVGPAQVVDALNAVAAVGIRRRDDLRTALRATLLNDPAHVALFDQAFHVYFRNPRLLDRALGLVLPGGRPADAVEPAPRRLLDALSGGNAGTGREVPVRDVERAGSYSDVERLRDKDFEDMSAAEQREAAALLKTGLAPLEAIPNRRFRQHPLGRRPDLRRSMQMMMRRDGQLLTLARKRRQERPPPIVLMCDISGSMSAYSRMFLLFAHTLASKSLNVHTFVFGTRLTNVTRRLRATDADDALRRIAHDVQDWDGGTRIADSLRHFNMDWGRRVLTQNASLILLTDGLERDTESDLEFQVARLHRSCRQLTWLNPMLRYDRFEPKAFGIRTMLPHVDLFLPAHNLASLSDMARVLGAGARRDAMGGQ